jgi:hypothetical protein
MSEVVAFDRTAIRSIKNEILAENPFTQIRVERGRLIVRVPQGKLTEKQRELATTYKEELVEYLTTPPAHGHCIGGHPSEWILTKYGDWVCSCYREKHLRAIVSFKTDEECLNKLF